MKTVSGMLALGVVLVSLPLGAQARPLHHQKDKAAEAAQARRAVDDRFAARMNRLDALMGTPSSSRTRSASADH